MGADTENIEQAYNEPASIPFLKRMVWSFSNHMLFVNC